LDIRKWETLLQAQLETEKIEPVIFERFLKVVEQYIEKKKRILVIGASEYEIKQLRERGYKNLTGINLYPKKGILRMDMHNLKFRRESFESILAKNVIEHSFCPWMTFLEIRSVLKRNGLVVITFQIFKGWNYLIQHPFLVTEEWLNHIGRWFGFETIYSKTYEGQIVRVWKKGNVVSPPSLNQINWEKFVKQWEEKFH